MAFLRHVTDGLMSLMSPRPWQRPETAICFAPLSRADIEATYRGSGLVRKIIDIPAEDMTREWRDWQAEADQITAIEAEEKRLGLRDKVRRAEILRGLGGGALVLGLPGDPAQPVPSTLGRGALAFVHVVSRWQLVLGDMVDDPMSPLFGGPSQFEMADSRGRRVLLHPSRVVPFRADPLPELVAVSSRDDAYWGDSRVQRVADAARDCEQARSGFAALVRTARLRRIAIPGLLDITATEAGEQQLMRRLQAMAAGESSWSLTAIDAGSEDGKGGEAITDQQVTWSGMPEIMFAFATFLAAVADMPVTRLMGRAAEGMNASGSSQQQDWHKAVAARQENDLRPCLEALDRALIPSALGSVPAEIWWQFAPLDAPDQTTEATRFKTIVDAMEKVQATGAIPDEAFAKALQSTLVENGFMPGLEAALAEIPEAERYGLSPEPDDGDDLPDDDPSALQMGDAAKGGKGKGGFGGRHGGYNPSQPRVPSGPDGGQWTSGREGGAPAVGVKLGANDLAIIKDYTGAGYRDMNYPLRGFGDRTPEVDRRIAAMDSAVAKGRLDADATLYRGVNKFGADKIIGGGLKKGDVISDPAFASTSRSESVAKRFHTAAKDNLTIRIKVKAGTAALDVTRHSDNAGESEVVFPRKTNMRVVRFDKKSRILDVEIVDG